MFVYLDNSATTKQYEEVNEEMLFAMKDCFGNPSSLHSLGVESEKKLRQARKTFATTLGASEDEVFFNSGGTEGDNSVIFGSCEARKRIGNKIITTKVEHPAVLECFKKLEQNGFEVAYIGVDEKCRLNLDQLKSEINDNTILISIMSVNNETGTIMPIKEISGMKNKALFHTDAVQGYGKMNLQNFGADFITVSGHKIHGPKGIGGMYIKKGTNLPAYIVGGGQEKHQRSGTENVPAILGFGKACKMAYDNLDTRLSTMEETKQYLLTGIKNNIRDIIINSPDDSLSSVLNISFLGTRGEVILHTLEQDKIYISTGSACSSNKKGQSHVLESMGLSFKEIEGALRFSFSEFNTIAEMDYVLDKLEKAVTRFRKLGTYR